MPTRRIHGYITLGILILLLVITGMWYAISPTVGLGNLSYAFQVEEVKPLYEGDHIIANLRTMKLELRNGTTTIETMDIISKGKPGSYYETIGGAYLNDYKEKSHFSSIGHVYMPYSIHVFGNFFIHGVPYYPDGTKVSTEYSGGCVRLNDEDAKRVFEFIKTGTPIVITEGNDTDFIPSKAEAATIESIDMTRLTVATISLEVLKQDSEIADIDGTKLTTRRKLLPRLLVEGDDGVSVHLTQSLGNKTFIDYMNKKAQALGLTNTVFTSVTSPVLTTREDLDRFMQYIKEYKTYLLTISTSTQPLSQ
jgi:hypothetical protein